MPRPRPRVFRPLAAKRRRSEAVSSRLEAAILEGVFPPGGKLPTEAELGRQFGISRTVVREALHQLRSKGLVEGRRGSGSYVRGLTFERLETDLLRFTHLNDSAEIIPEFLDLRSVIEPECARLLATQENPDLEAARAALAQMQRKRISIAEFSVADVEFHHGIARASGHRLYAALISCLKPATERYAMLTYESAETMRHALADHVEILRCIEARQPDRAAAAMRRHLAFSREHFQELLRQTSSPPSSPPQ